MLFMLIFILKSSIIQRELNIIGIPSGNPAVCYGSHGPFTSMIDLSEICDCP